MADIIFSVGSGVAKSVFGDSQYPIRKIIEERAEQMEAQSCLGKMFTTVNSNQFAERFTEMTAFEDFDPVGENGAYTTTGMEEGFDKTIRPTTWKKQFSVSKEAIDDAKTMELRGNPKKLTTAFYRTRENLGAAMYGAAINGLSSIKFRGMNVDCKTADGVNLFATNHVNRGKRTVQCNRFSDAFSSESLTRLEAAMQDFRDHDGNLLTVMPNTIMIANDPELKMEIFKVLGADRDPNSANNGFNMNFDRWNVIINPYLNKWLESGIHPWVVMDTEYSEDYAGAIWLEREKLNFRSEVESNDANTWKARARFGAGFFDWRFAAVGGVPNGSPLAST